MWEHIRRQDAAACAEGKFPPVVILVDLGGDPVITEVGYCVQMCDESEFRPVFIAQCGGNMSVQVALGVHFHVRDPHCKKLPVQMLCQFELAGGGGHGIALLVAGSSDHCIF